jgi:hypothetical protein
MASVNNLPNPKIFHLNCTVKIRASRSPGKSVSLCQFTQLKAAKDGCMSEYPAIEGERDPANIDHWYWHFTYKEQNLQVSSSRAPRLFPVGRCQPFTTSSHKIRLLSGF